MQVALLHHATRGPNQPHKQLAFDKKMIVIFKVSEADTRVKMHSHVENADSLFCVARKSRQAACVHNIKRVPNVDKWPLAICVPDG